jgi:hypothetical protein
VNVWARILRPWLLVLCSACACDGDRHAESSQSEAGAPADAGVEPASYRAVREIFERSCAYNRCHSGVPIGGALPLAPGGDHASVLVGVPSCEYPPLERVKPGEPEQSWLMIKLTADVRPKSDPFADYILFEPEPGWDESQRGCRDRTPDGTPLFGQRMPLTAPNMLPDEELAVIREWIREGAPH